MAERRLDSFCCL